MTPVSIPCRQTRIIRVKSHLQRMSDSGTICRVRATPGQPEAARADNQTLRDREDVVSGNVGNFLTGATLRASRASARTTRSPSTTGNSYGPPEDGEPGPCAFVFPDSFPAATPWPRPRPPFPTSVKRIALLLLALAAASAPAALTDLDNPGPALTSVHARQRYPWKESVNSPVVFMNSSEFSDSQGVVGWTQKRFAAWIDMLIIAPTTIVSESASPSAATESDWTPCR